MKDFMNRLGELQPATLVLLIFAAILLLLLLVLIIVTIKVLKSSDDDDYEEDEPKGKDEDDSDEEEEEEDETSRKVNEAVKSVEETKAKVEAEKIAKAAKKEKAANDDEDRESAKAKVEEIAKAVKKGASDSEDDEDEEEYEEQEELEEPEDSEEEYEDEYEEDSSDDEDEELAPDDEATGELDTVKIREALAKEKRDAEESGVAQGETARERAESPEYNASFDSAFVEKPDNDTDKPEPLIPNPTPDIPKGKTLDAAEEAIVAGAVKAARSGGKAAKAAKTAGKAAVKTAEKAAPKQKKKQSIEKPAAAVAKGSSKYYWYNEQDMEGLARQEDRYFKYHYFDDADDAILDLVTEMYDCAYVRTEQLQRIAYGITFKSLGMKEILQSEEDLSFNKNRATKEPTEDDKEEVYIKWCEYVDSFQDIVKIEAPTEVKVYIKEKMYEYGRKDVEELMHSPY